MTDKILNSPRVVARDDPGTNLRLHGMLPCNDAKLEQNREAGGTEVWKMIGDPTEGAWVWSLPIALLASVASELNKIYLRSRAKKTETTNALFHKI